MKDRGAWHAAAHGVTKSQTRLSNWTATTDYMGPALKCQKNFQDPHIMLVKLWVTSWVLPVEPVPHSITWSPRHISGSDLESQRLCNTLTAPCPQLPTSRTSPVADCVCSETLAFCPSSELLSRRNWKEREPIQAFVQVLRLLFIECLLSWNSAPVVCLHYFLLFIW